MTTDEVKKAIEEVGKGDAVLLDVRRSDEWSRGHAKPAIHFDSDRILKNADFPNEYKSKKIYVYCQSGGRAGRVKSELTNQGFSKVHNLGGLSDWQQAGGE